MTITPHQPPVPVTDPFAVPETLVGCHAITTKLRRSLEGRRVGHTGLVEAPWDESVFSVSVSKEQLQRTLRIMDAIIRAIESHGGEFIRPKKDCVRTRIRIAGEWVGFQVLEIVDKNEKATVTDEARSRLLSRERWEYKTTGRLKFEILGPQKAGGRRSWTDCTFHRLEDKLGEIVKWLLAAAEAEKEARLAEEERQRYWAEVHRKSAEKERLRIIEARHREELEEHAAKWAKAESLRAFIRAAEPMFSSSTDESLTKGWFVRWIVWAREHADRIDPLKGAFAESQRKRFGNRPAAERE